MSVVNDLVDEWTQLANARLPWEIYWRDIARYVLPQTEHFDRLVASSAYAAINSVVSTPGASEKSKDLYDMTSLWGIERLTAGMISLKTPETERWHDMGLDDYFGTEPAHEEAVALERLRDYQFKVRSNPKSGFWASHRAAVKSMCGFGDGWQFVEETEGTSAKVPYTYSYMPLTELYPAVGPDGQPNRMFRGFRWSALQVVAKFGYDKVNERVRTMANDPKQKHETVLVLHAVKPRDDKARSDRMGVRGSKFASYYCLPDEKHLIGESGFFEFPFMRYAWSNTGTRPFSEGPVAYALGEIKSLQEMSKNELIATQLNLRPAYATQGKNFVKLNFNPGATNPGLVSADGRPLVVPLNQGNRPDFAQAVLETRRGSVREMLYLNLWQILLQPGSPQETATEALIRAQEKGEMLGPVGISFNEGLAMMVDREIGILGRKRAFDSGSPLEMPDSMADKDVSPTFNSPLDRLRRMGEMVGMQRLVEFAMTLAGGDPAKAAKIMARFDTDEMIERAQQILGAPIKALRSREEAQGESEGSDQMQQAMGLLAMTQGAGEAAKSVGEGGAALATGAETATRSPALKSILGGAPQIARAAGAGMGQ